MSRKIQFSVACVRKVLACLQSPIFQTCVRRVLPCPEKFHFSVRPVLSCPERSHFSVRELCKKLAQPPSTSIPIFKVFQVLPGFYLILKDFQSLEKVFQNSILSSTPKDCRNSVLACVFPSQCTRFIHSVTT